MVFFIYSRPNRRNNISVYFITGASSIAAARMRVTLLILSMMVVLGHGSYLPNLNFTMPHLNFSLPQFNLPSIFGSGKVEDRNDGSASLQGIWNNNIEVSFFVALVSLLKRLSLMMAMVTTASFPMVAS